MKRNLPPPNAPPPSPSRPGDGRCASDEALAALVDGRLGRDEVLHLAAHLRLCPACFEVFAETVLYRPGDSLLVRLGRRLRLAWRGLPFRVRPTRATARRR